MPRTRDDHPLRLELLERLRSDPALLDWLEAGSLDGLWYWDLEHPEDEWMSARLVEVLGFSPEEVPHRSSWWQEHIFPEDLPGVLASFAAHCERGAPYDQVVRYRRKDGSTCWIRCRGLVLRDGSGRPQRMLGAHTEVSAIKEAEESLRRSNAELSRRIAERTAELAAEVARREAGERLFRVMVDESPVGNLVVDAGGRIIHANREAERIFAYPPGAMVGMPVDDLVPDHLRAGHAGQRAAYRADPRPRRMGAGKALVGVRRDGQVVPMEVGLSPVELDGRPGVLAAVVDRSDRQRAERLEAELRQQLRALIEGLPQLVWTCAPEGGCDHLSRQWVDYTGLAEAQQLGLGWLDQVHAEDREGLMRTWRAAVASGDSLTSEYRLRRSDGTFRWFAVRAAPQRGEDGRIKRWIGTSTDIDDRKQLELRLRERGEELERSNRALETFAFAASHDLREPLRKITLFADILRGHLPPGDAAAGDILDRLSSAGERMAALVQSLLGYAQLRPQRERWERIDGDALCRQVVDDLALAVAEHGATVDCGPLGELYGDRSQLAVLLQNLIANAIKFHHPGRRPLVTLRAWRQDGWVALSCSDDGIGIPADRLEQVFGMFTRLHSRQDYPGTGLGLASARKVAELHGGSISADSREGAGTTFTIRLPAPPS